VQIQQVAPDSPAAKAGLKQGDVITKVDGKEVPDVTDFLRNIGARKPGQQVSLGVRRGKEELTLKATLGKRPAEEAAGGGTPLTGPSQLKELGRPSAFLGVQVQELTPELGKKLGVKGDHGAVVEEVVPNSPAAKAGLQRDDVIISANGKAVKTTADLRAAVQKAGAGKEVTLRYQRGGEVKEAKATPQSGFGGPIPRLRDGIAPLDMESLWDQSAQIRKLQQRVEILEKQVRTLEKQLHTQK
jgi:serine protease Do